jgi:hypothetical protein
MCLCDEKMATKGREKRSRELAFLATSVTLPPPPRPSPLPAFEVVAEQDEPKAEHDDVGDERVGLFVSVACMPNGVSNALTSRGHDPTRLSG